MERIPIGKFTAFTATTGVTLVAAVIFFRRLSGVSLQDLAAGEVAVFAGCFAIVATVLLRVASREITVTLDSASIGLPAGLLLIVFVAGLSSDPQTVLIGLLAGGGIIVAAHFAFVGQSSTEVKRTAPCGSTTEIFEASEGSRDGSVDAANLQREAVETKIVRKKFDGTVTLEGCLTFEFAVGETVKLLHVPVWPSLPSPPNVQTTLEGVEGRVRVPLTRPYGFRIEIRLSEALDEPAEGILHFVANCRTSLAAA